MSPHDESRRILEGILSETDRSEFEDLAPERPTPEVLAGYVAGALDPASTRALDRYFDQHPERRGELEELRAFMAGTPDEETTGTEPATSRRRLRRLRPATVILFGLCAAGGYGGGMWHGRHTLDLTTEQAMEIAEDPNQPFRNNAIYKLQRVQNRITEILAEVADSDPANAPTPREAERIGRDARLRLYRQAGNAIKALEDLLLVQNSVVVEDARKRLITILSNVARGDPADAPTPRDRARLRLFHRDDDVIMAVVDLSRAEDPVVVEDVRKLLAEIKKLTR